jgi:hypothetical protein
MIWTNKPRHMNLNYNIHSSKSKHYTDNKHSIILNLSSQHEDLTEKLKKYADPNSKEF